MGDSDSDLAALLPVCEELVDIYLMMQKQVSHRLQKISLFILKIADLRALCESGCKWLVKESASRQKEIEGHGTSDWEGILTHDTALKNIENNVAQLLQMRMVWLRNFASKVDAAHPLLERAYEDISELCGGELEGEEEQLVGLYKDFYLEKEKYRKLLPAPTASSSSTRQRTTRSSNSGIDTQNIYQQTAQNSCTTRSSGRSKPTQSVSESIELDLSSPQKDERGGDNRGDSRGDRGDNRGDNTDRIGNPIDDDSSGGEDKRDSRQKDSKNNDNKDDKESEGDNPAVPVVLTASTEHDPITFDSGSESDEEKPDKNEAARNVPDKNEREPDRIEGVPDRNEREPDNYEEKPDRNELKPDKYQAARNVSISAPRPNGLSVAARNRQRLNELTRDTAAAPSSSSSSSYSLPLPLVLSSSLPSSSTSTAAVSLNSSDGFTSSISRMERFAAPPSNPENSAGSNTQFNSQAGIRLNEGQITVDDEEDEEGGEEEEEVIVMGVSGTLDPPILTVNESTHDEDDDDDKANDKVYWTLLYGGTPPVPPVPPPKGTKGTGVAAARGVTTGTRTVTTFPAQGQGQGVADTHPHIRAGVVHTQVAVAKRVTGPAKRLFSVAVGGICDQPTPSGLPPNSRASSRRNAVNSLVTLPRPAGGGDESLTAKQVKVDHNRSSGDSTNNNSNSNDGNNDSSSSSSSSNNGGSKSFSGNDNGSSNRSNGIGTPVRSSIQVEEPCNQYWKDEDTSPIQSSTASTNNPRHIAATANNPHPHPMAAMITVRSTPVADRSTPNPCPISSPKSSPNPFPNSLSPPCRGDRPHRRLIGHSSIQDDS